MPEYIKRRTAQDDYKNFYGRVFGKSKDVKILAAKALINGDDLTPHKAAFKTGELQYVYELLEKCDQRVEREAKRRIEY